MWYEERGGSCLRLTLYGIAQVFMLLFHPTVMQWLVQVFDMSATSESWVLYIEKQASNTIQGKCKSLLKQLTVYEVLLTIQGMHVFSRELNFYPRYDIKEAKVALLKLLFPVWDCLFKKPPLWFVNLVFQLVLLVTLEKKNQGEFLFQLAVSLVAQNILKLLQS